MVRNDGNLIFNFQFIIVYGLKNHRPLKVEDYEYPMWANVLGWGIAASSVAMIPLFAVIQFIMEPGTIREVNSIPKTLRNVFSIILCSTENESNGHPMVRETKPSNRCEKRTQDGRFAGEE